MDYILLLFVAFFGVVPPVLVGWFAYRQGKKGEHLALQKYDDAKAHMNFMNETLGMKIENIKLPEIPDPPLLPEYLSLNPTQVEDLHHSLTKSMKDEILPSVNASVKGTLGNFFKDLYKEGDQVMNQEAQNQMSQMSMEDRLKAGLMARITNFISNFGE